MKGIFNLLTLLCIVFNYIIPVSATNTISITENNTGVSIQMDATDKTQFALNMTSVYENRKESNNILEPSIEKINELLLQVPLVDEEEKEAINAELAKYGVYEYINSNEVDTVSTFAVAPDSGDVDLSAPLIYYQAWEDSWTITFGGSWNNDEWNSNSGYCGPLIPTKNVGDADAFGVGFTNTGGDYQSSVIRASAYITDISGSPQNSTNLRTDGDGANGFGFRLQDYKSYVNLTGSVDYIGYSWSGLCTYDTYFGSYSGVATSYYVHTYDSCTINSISFGVNGTVAGITADLSDAAKSFIAYSSDKTFGVYN